MSSPCFPLEVQVQVQVQVVTKVLHALFRARQFSPEPNTQPVSAKKADKRSWEKTTKWDGRTSELGVPAERVGCCECSDRQQRVRAVSVRRTRTLRTRRPNRPFPRFLGLVWVSSLAFVRSGRMSGGEQNQHGVAQTLE